MVTIIRPSRNLNNSDQNAITEVGRAHLAGMEAQQPFDSGMPGGEFWFLPNWDAENGKLVLPVPQVIDWLLDLLDVPSFQGFQPDLAMTYVLLLMKHESCVRPRQPTTKNA